MKKRTFVLPFFFEVFFIRIPPWQYHMGSVFSAHKDTISQRLHVRSMP
jgi:hypothetical protein